MNRYILYYETDSFEDMTRKVTNYWDIIVSQTSKSRMKLTNNGFGELIYRFDWVGSCDGEYNDSPNDNIDLTSGQLKYTKRLSENDFFLIKL